VQLPVWATELYRLKNSLAEESPDIAAQLNKELGNWEVDLPNPLFREPADWRTRHLKFYDDVYELDQPD
jgi:hypothetical protein